VIARSLCAQRRGHGDGHGRRGEHVVLRELRELEEKRAHRGERSCPQADGGSLGDQPGQPIDRRHERDTTDQRRKPRHPLDVIVGAIQPLVLEQVEAGWAQLPSLHDPDQAAEGRQRRVEAQHLVHVIAGRTELPPEVHGRQHQQRDQSQRRSQLRALESVEPPRRLVDQRHHLFLANKKLPAVQGVSQERLKGLEPSTFCMARAPIEPMFSVYGKSPYGTGPISMVVEGGFGT
jgi:hypothetical protein